MTTMNAFDKFTSDLTALTALTAHAAQVFDGAVGGVLGVRSHSDRTVTVQMKEADLLAWCEAHGVTPAVSEQEADYTRYGGGFALQRYHDAVVSESEAGRILLVSCKEVSTRPAAASVAVVGAGAVGAESAAA